MIQKKRLNLFTRNTRKSLSSVLSEKTVMYATVMGVVLFMVFIFFSISSIYQKNTKQKLLNEKQVLLNYLIENKTGQAETGYFISKKEQFKKFLKDDAQFLPYYTILQSTISGASDSATIKNMTIDKTRETEFVINFNDYDAMYKYIRYIESEPFLKNFDTLTLTSLSLSQAGGTVKSGYELNFSGVFKTIAVDKAP